MNDKIILIPFHAEHVKLMQVRDHELRNIFAEGSIDDKLKALEMLGNGATILYDGRILGVMGFMEMWSGVCEVWVLPSEHIGRYGIVFAKLVKKNLKMLQEVKKFHRLQVTAKDDIKHNRWLTWLGFVCEGTLRKYSVNQDNYKIWSRI